MTRSSPQLRLLRSQAPWMTLTALVALAWLLPNRAAISDDAIAHKAKVAAAMSAIPYFISGGWVGQDASDRIPRQAQELLRPNAIVSRSYSAPDRPMVHLLIVHCGDARDMIGHYPPICYPSSGWIPQSGTGVEHQLEVLGRRIPAQEYIFNRPRDQFVEDSIRVLNVFILPSGQVTSQIHDINRQSERLALTIHGVAQLQLITLANVPIDQALQAGSELLNGMTGVLEALNVSKEESGDIQSHQ